ncbi:hypothetical protein TD95_003248 [Thielaviopsis punctulata]|uniref:Protein farnesyltransferase/geranylgeranyltransferase type-1 subunit alpha n=1 Tax=Thielaviopsis punctulata TaxID=72032 RepID=A0A0F4ZBF3_9PEZI|nr:hypothetical protein TD95_003248 [Thielaviopsis punctulata]
MPPKPKAGVKATKEPESTPDIASAATVADRSLQTYFLTNPVSQKLHDLSLADLDATDFSTWANAKVIRDAANGKLFSSVRLERDYWKTVQKDGVPYRNLSKEYDWGTDEEGRAISEYSPAELAERFKQQQETLRQNLRVSRLPSRYNKSTMAPTKEELYAPQTIDLSDDPVWEDVPPIPTEEPEGSLASIAYPPKYAEASAYLRIVMANNEMSARAFRLTAHMINLNPAHYTVWLYRFQIFKTLQLSFDDEVEWLNKVSLEHLKNYQIWHHRQLLVDLHYPAISTDRLAVAALMRSETLFIAQMLEADTKNYHVWSYRQWLVRRLALWDIGELLATQNYIEEDVRNNSAWSHRFFIVFSDPAVSSGDAVHATEPDAKVSPEIVDRELKYAREKIDLAPQNPSAWNYLRGVLAKAGRDIGSEKEYVGKFVQAVGEDEEKVLSTHALDVLAEIYAAEGDKAKATACLQRLSDKWDPIRAGYWQLRQQQLAF